MSEMKDLRDATLSAEIQTYLVDPGTGDKLRCRFNDPTDEQQRELAELQEKAENGDEAAADEFEQLVIGELFKSDKITPASPMAQKQAVITALFRALGDNDAIQDARELLDVEGNQ